MRRHQRGAEVVFPGAQRLERPVGRRVAGQVHRDLARLLVGQLDPQVGLQPAVPGPVDGALEVAPRRGVVVGGGQLHDHAVVAEPADLLHDALAVGRRAHDGGRPMVLERRGEDLARAGRVTVDQHGQGHPRQPGLVRIGAVDDHLRAAFVRDQRALGDEQVRQVHRGLEHPAGIAADVDHQGVQGAEAGEGPVELLGGPPAEGGHGHVADAPAGRGAGVDQAGVADRGVLQLAGDQGQVALAAFAVGHVHRQPVRTGLVDDPQQLLGAQLLDDPTVHGQDAVPDLDAALLGRGALDREQHLAGGREGSKDHSNALVEPRCIPVDRRNLVLVVVPRVGVEPFDQAAEGPIEHLVRVHLLHVRPGDEVADGFVAAEVFGGALTGKLKEDDRH